MNVLVVSPDDDLRSGIVRRLERSGHQVVQAPHLELENHATQGSQTPQRASSRGANQVSLVPVDASIGQTEVAELLAAGRRVGGSPSKVVVLDTQPTIRRAVQAVRQGALDYLATPVSASELDEVMRQAGMPVSVKCQSKTNEPPGLDPRKASTTVDLSQVILGNSPTLPPRQAATG